MQIRSGGNNVHLDAMLNAHRCHPAGQTLAWEAGHLDFTHTSIACPVFQLPWASSSNEKNKSIHSLPRDAIERACENPLCMVVWSESL